VAEVAVGDATKAAPSSSPLAGVEVVDFSHAAAGPFCTQHLGDMGAQVIKIEPPDGDMLRHVDEGPSGPGMGTYFLGLNRNKRSIRLDLQTSVGREIALRLCAGADVVVENHRPGVMERLGLDYATVRSSNPRVVYASISAFGESGPLRDKPGMDIVVQAFAGIMGLTGPSDGDPVKVGAPIADFATGYAAAMGVLAALYERTRSGEGQRVSLSMLNVVASLLSNCATGFLMSGIPIQRLGSAHPQIVPYQAFRGSDGEYIVIGILNERFWKKLCAMLDAGDLASSPKFARNADRVRNRDELVEIVSSRIAEHPVEEWERACEAFDVPYARVNSLKDLFDDPQVEAQSVVLNMQDPDMGRIPAIAQPVRFSRTPADSRTAPHRLGADTAAVLREIGYSESEIQRLVDSGIV